MEIGGVIFCCVDSIATRRFIWEAVRDRVRLLIDTRMSAEVVRILTAGNGPSRKHYSTTLFAPEQAHAGPCTAKSTIYTSNVAASLAVGQFTKYLAVPARGPGHHAEHPGRQADLRSARGQEGRRRWFDMTKDDCIIVSVQNGLVQDVQFASPLRDKSDRRAIIIPDQMIRLRGPAATIV